MENQNTKRNGDYQDTDQQLSIEDLATQQGVKPFDYQRLRSLGDVWPESENVDEFTVVVRKWREDASERSLP